jgi:hypothetical protein
VNNDSTLADTDNTPSPMDFVLFLGFDAAHTNTKTADVIVKMVAYRLYL